MAEEPETPEIPTEFRIKLSSKEYSGALFSDITGSYVKIFTQQIILGGISVIVAYIICSFFVENFDFDSSIWFFLIATILSFILAQTLSPCKNLSYPNEDSAILQPTTFRFDADSVTIDIEKNSHTVMKWAHVHKVAIDTTVIKIHLDPVAAYYLPLDQVRNTEDPYVLYTRLKGYWTDAQPKKETGSHATSAA